MRRYETDKKLKSILYLALGAEGKRVFSQKHPNVIVVAISFKKISHLLEAAFIKPTNIMFERYKLLSRKQGQGILRRILGGVVGLSKIM